MIFNADIPAPEDAVRIAKRLRRLGVNLVRYPSGHILTKDPFPTLNPAALERLRYLLKALKEEGIYLDLIINGTGYLFRPAVDKLPSLPGNPPEISFESKLYIFYPRMVDLQVAFAKKMIDALSLPDEPQLAMVEIHNEGSLLRGWETGHLDPYLAGEYRAELERQWNEFLRAKYGTADAQRPLVRAKSVDSFSSAQVNDYILFLVDRDNYFYVDHPEMKDIRDWRMRNASSAASGLKTILNVAAARVAGFPYTVSEYNQPFPNTYRSEIDPTLAAVATFQDWDALVHFSYFDHSPGDRAVRHAFDLSGDWTEFANIGQSAWLFRTAVVQAGRGPLEIAVLRELRLRAGRMKRSHGITDLLAEFGVYDPALALLHPVALVKGEDRPDAQPLSGAGPSPFRSDTGELEFDSERKLFLVAAPLAAGALGLFGAGRKVTAGPVDIEPVAGGRGFASILLTSLDGQPLVASRRTLLSISGYSMPTQPGSDPPRPQRLVPYGSEAGWYTLEKDLAYPDKPSGWRRNGLPPVWMERVECYLTLHTPASRLEVYPLDARGARMAPLFDEAIERVPGGFRIHLQAAGQQFTPWYEITGSATPESELRIRVVDQNNRPIWARVEVPPGRYLVVGEHGMEYERLEQSVEVAPATPAAVSLRLRPWVRMRKRGWWSGDVHVHHTPEETRDIVQAEDLDIAVLTTRGAHLDWKGSSAGAVVSVPPHHLVTLLNYEDERRGGSWILNGLLRPLDLGRLGAWYPPGITLVRQARAQRAPGGLFPWFDIDMPIWWEVPVMMALQPPDSLDVLHNQFMQYGIDTGEYWGRPYDRKQWPGRQGFVDYSLGLYYRYLNLGFRLPATAGTGSGVMPNPTGYNRVYAQVNGPLTIQKWYAAIRDGRSFITNGPILFFRTRPAGARIKAFIEARAREPIERIEIIANGAVLRRFILPEGSRAFKGNFTFDPRRYSWVLARCFLKPGATIRLAQSSPVYLPGQWDARSDARYFIHWIDDLIARVPSEAGREELLSLYRRARAFYEAKAP